MKRILKNTLAVLIAAVMVFGAAPLAGFVGLELPDISALFTAKAETAETSGTCGDNLTWTFDESTDTLTIRGEGEMWDCGYFDENGNITVDENSWSRSLGEVEKIIIEEGVTYIGVYSLADFYNDYDEASLLIPSTVKSIGAYAFYSSSINSVTFAENSQLESIGRYSFADTRISTDIEIPASVNVIDECAFRGAIYCRKELVRVTFEENSKLQTVGKNAFRGYIVFGGGHSGYMVELPDGVTTNIEDCAFDGANCVHIPESITEIGNNIFGNPELFRDGYICSTTENCYAKNYADENGFAFQLCEGEIDGVCGNSLTWNLNLTTGDLMIGGVGDMWDWECGSAPWSSYIIEIKRIIISEGVTSIGENAFDVADFNLVFESITVPESIVKIKTPLRSKVLNYNAADAVNVETLSSASVHAETINIGPKVKTIELVYEGLISEVYEEPIYLWGNNEIKRFNVDPENPYYSSDENGILFNKDKTELMIYPRLRTDEEYIVPESVKSIKAMAFSYNDNLEKIELSNVERIGFVAFMGCENLIDITLPDSVREIDMFALNGTARAKKAAEAAMNDHIKTVYFEDHLIAIYSNDTDATYDIKPGTKSIAGGAFVGLENLGTLNIPESVACIGDLAFAGRVAHINVDPDNPYYTSDEYGAVYTKDMKTFVSFPIASDATEYTVVPTVTELAHGAFIGCYLKKINLPDSVTDLNEMTFTHTTALETISIPSGVEKLDYMSLQLSGIKTAYIPKSVKRINASVFSSCDSLTDVYFEGTEDEWNAIVIEAYNDSLENATIHFNSDYHTHKYTKTVTKEATCTENGSATYTCECGETYIEVIPAGHVATTITVPATCKATGMSYDVCVNCGASMGNVKVLPKTDHTPGEWETVVEATTETEGKKVKKCKVCDIVLEEKIIPKLAVLIDKDTGVVIEYNPDDYEGTPKLNVDETFDEIAIQILNLKTGAVSQQIFNITMTLDGVEIQPNGYVTIRLPIPEGFDKDYIHIYYINSQTGEAEKFDSRIEGDYIVFETNHFSYYAVAQVCDGSVSIKTPSTTTVTYGDSIILHADITGNLPEGAYIEWTADNGNFKVVETSADGTSCKVTPESSGDTTFTATVYDANGNIISEDDQKMTSKAGFLQKIIAFFKKLFGLNKIIPELIRKSL